MTGDARTRVDDPAPGVRRITLNRPEKRNAINNGMRAELFDALEAADVDDAVHVTHHPRRGAVLLVGLRPEARRDDDRPVLHGRRRRHAGRATSPRAGSQHLGSRQARDRAGARLRDGGRHRARRRVRPRVRRRRRDVQLSRRARASARPTSSTTRGSSACATRWSSCSPATRSPATTRCAWAREPRVPRRRARARALAIARADRGRARRAAADQQAQRAPGDGDHGHPHRHPRRLRAAGPREQPRIDAASSSSTRRRWSRTWRGTADGLAHDVVAPAKPIASSILTYSVGSSSSGTCSHSVTITAAVRILGR